jgi:hypothetical protein
MEIDISFLPIRLHNPYSFVIVKNSNDLFGEFYIVVAWEISMTISCLPKSGFFAGN